MTLPTFWIRARSATWFRSALMTGPRTTSAFSFLSRKTVPTPPRPACLRRAAFRRESQKEKFRQPMRLWSEPFPAETTETFRRSSGPSAYMCVKISEQMWLSAGSSGASSIRMTPRGPSIRTTTSRSAFPWISRASKPQNFRSGP